MTLVAFATYPDHAEFITDTAAYTHRLRDFIPDAGDKHQLIARHNAAVLAQGAPVILTRDVQTAIVIAADLDDVTSFDELTALASPLIRSLWDDALDDPESGIRPDTEATFYLLGPSESAGHYVAVQYASEHAFAREYVTGPVMIPAPYAFAPTALELARIRGWHADRLDDPDTAHALDVWASRPPLPTPQDADEWVILAHNARLTRALDHFAHVPVAGRVIHGQLSAEGMQITTLHTFDDTGAELDQLLAGTEHPHALAAPCYCDSGQTFGECCALRVPCGCRSGRAFGDCCVPVGAH